MATFIAGSAGLLAIFTGTQLSRPAFQTDRDGASPDGFAGHDVKQLLHRSDASASSPIAAADPQLARAPSVLDVLESKWFGSVESSDASSRFHDSAASMSPPERRQRLQDVNSSESLRSGGYAANGPAAKPAAASSRSHTAGGGVHNSGDNSHSSGGSSASRQIAVSVTASSAARRRPPPPMPHASASEPSTPEWMDRSSLTGNLSALNSETATPLARPSSSGDLLSAAAAAAVHEARNDSAFESDLTQRGSNAAAVALLCASQASAPQPRNPQAPELFGTWAQRQKHFPPLPLAADSGSTHGTDDGTARWRPAGRGLAPHERAAADAAARPRGSSAGTDTDEDDRVKENAWKWRFGRRWRAEQAKQFDPEYGRQPGDEDGWDEALGYLDACGGGIHLQIGRTVSMDKTLGGSKASLYRDNSSSSFMLDTESLNDEGPLARGSGDYGGATRSLGAMARKAQELLARQKEIDKNVSRVWGDAHAAGASWAGQFLPAVTIDMHGRFPFVLLRAKDATGAHKLLVRGCAGCTVQQLLQAARQEAALQSHSRRVPAATIELIGTGVMAWSRDRDRCVNVSEGRVVKTADTSVRTHADAARLAGALTSCSLPMNHKVTVEGQRML